MATMPHHNTNRFFKSSLVALVLGSAVMMFGCSGIMYKIKGNQEGGEDAEVEGAEVEAPEVVTPVAPATPPATTEPVATVPLTTDDKAKADAEVAAADKAAEDNDEADDEKTGDKTEDKTGDKADEKTTIATVKTTFTLRGGGGKVAVRGDVPKDASWTGMLKPGGHVFNVRPDNAGQKAFNVDVEAGHVNTFCYDLKKDAWCSKH